MPGTVLSTVRIEPLDGTLSAFEAAFGPLGDQDQADSLHVDLSGAGYLEPPAVLFLLARLRRHLQGSGDLSVALVDDSGQGADTVARLDALADTCFDRALDELVGVRFVTLLDDASKGHWRAAIERRGLREDWRSSPGQRLPAEHSRIRAERRTARGFDPTIAADLSLTWQDPIVEGVLDSLTRGRGRYIPTHVMHEAAMNGVRHANSDVLATLASAARPANGRNADFVCSIWDDGDSIADTLSVDGRHAEPTRASSELFARELTVTEISEAGTRDWVTGNQGAIERDEPGLLLLAATFPGITSRPEEGSAVHPAASAELGLDGLPGMGLFVLSTTVTEVLKGVVEIRSGHWNLTLSAGNGSRSLAARLERSSDAAPFLGNLLTVRVPASSGIE